jgi:hypothetical protein
VLLVQKGLKSLKHLVLLHSLPIRLAF